MLKIELSSDHPNQSFELAADNCIFTIRLHEINEVWYADITIDDTVIMSSTRCVNNAWLIPDAYVNGKCGNFRFEATTYDYPNHANLDSHTFYYYTKDEYSETV